MVGMCLAGSASAATAHLRARPAKVVGFDGDKLAQDFSQRLANLLETRWCAQAEKPEAVTVATQVLRLSHHLVVSAYLAGATSFAPVAKVSLVVAPGPANLEELIERLTRRILGQACEQTESAELRDRKQFVCPWGDRDYCKEVCAAGSKASCLVLAELYRAGVDGDAEPELALPIYEKACAEGDSLACAALVDATIAELSHEKRGAKLAKRAALSCVRGSLVACTALAASSLQDPNEGVVAEAEQTLAKTCAAGEPLACAWSATRVKPDEKEPQVLAARKSTLEQSCDKGAGMGCELLGDDAWTGATAAETFKLAALYYERGCALGTTKACEKQRRVMAELAKLESAGPAPQ